MKKLLILLILPFAFGACKDKADKNPVSNINQATKDRDLQGTWQSECDMKPLAAAATGVVTLFQASVKSGRIQYVFEGSNVNQKRLLYNSTDCTGPETLVWNERGSFNIKENQKSNDGGRSIDMKYDKVFLTVGDENGAKIANDATLCGFKNWSVGKEQAVTGKSSDINCYGQQVPRENANIYRIEKPAGDQKWQLILGANPAKETRSNDRPAKLSDIKFHKK